MGGGIHSAFLFWLPESAFPRNLELHRAAVVLQRLAVRHVRLSRRSPQNRPAAFAHITPACVHDRICSSEYYPPKKLLCRNPPSHPRVLLISPLLVLSWFSYPHAAGPTTPHEISHLHIGGVPYFCGVTSVPTATHRVELRGCAPPPRRPGTIPPHTFILPCPLNQIASAALQNVLGHFMLNESASTFYS